MTSGSDAENKAHEMTKAEIDEEKEKRSRHHHEQDHARGNACLFPRRPGDLAHLLADLPQKFYRTADCHDVPLETPYIASGDAEGKSVVAMAGVEGLEPPTPGFGDRCSTN
jgi:hypothetical protein